MAKKKGKKGGFDPTLGDFLERAGFESLSISEKTNETDPTESSVHPRSEHEGQREWCSATSSVIFCEVCNKLFVSRAKFDEHMRIHLSSEPLTSEEINYRDRGLGKQDGDSGGAIIPGEIRSCSEQLSERQQLLYGD